MPRTPVRRAVCLIASALLATLVVDRVCLGQPPAVEAESGGDAGDAPPVGDAPAVGDKVEVLWQGTWYKASVIATPAPGQWKIHYEGYGSNWDQVVGPNRIRLPGGAAVPESQPAGAGGAPARTDFGFFPGEIVRVGRKSNLLYELVAKTSPTSWRVRECDSSPREFETPTANLQSLRASVQRRGLTGMERGLGHRVSVPSYSYNASELKTWLDRVEKANPVPPRLQRLDADEAPEHFFVAPSGEWAAVATDGLLRIWDLADGSERLRIPHHGARTNYGYCWAVATDTREKVLATVRTHSMSDDTAAICFWGLETGELLQKHPLAHRRSTVVDLLASPDGRWLAARVDDERARQSGNGYVRWFDFRTLQLAGETAFPLRHTGGGAGASFSTNASWLTPQSMAFVDDATLMVLAQTGSDRYTNHAVYSADPTARRFRLAKKLRAEKKVIAMAMAPSREVYATSEYAKRKGKIEYTAADDRRRTSDVLHVVIRDTATHEEFRRVDLPFSGYSNAELSFSPDGKRLMVSNGLPYATTVIDVETGGVVGAMGIHRARYVPGGDFAIGFNAGGVQLWSVDPPAPVAAFQTFAAERAWATITADGDFFASGVVRRVIDPRTIATYHRPDRVRLALDAVPLLKLRSLPPGYRRPGASLSVTGVGPSSAKVRFKADLLPGGDQPPAAEFQRRERPLPENVADSLQSIGFPATATGATVTVPFPPGKNRMTLDAAVTDSFGIKSRRATIAVMRTEKVRELTGRLFVLAIGVAEHKFKEYNLEFSAVDAEAIVEAAQAQQGLAFSEVVTQTYINQRATIANIRDGLAWLERVATKDDVALVFIAGHGLRGRRGLYYVPHEGDAQAIQYTCLNWEEVAESISKVKAKQTLFLSDVCHAGAFAKSELAMQGPLAQRIAKIKRTLVFAAAGADELAFEGDGLNHGAFTLSVLGALAGEGDANGDGAVSLRELIEHATAATRKLTGGLQNPYVVTTGRIEPDLVLARVAPKQPGATAGGPAAPQRPPAGDSPPLVEE
ncbi:MAG: caspase family protein [Planctomycetota bacterium]